MESQAPMRRLKRGPWSQAEDNQLLYLIQTVPGLNWVKISEAMGSRNAKQCRERYHQNLKPSLNREPITQEEGEQIAALFRQLGPKWAEIAKRLNTNRADNLIKNWWNGVQNRKKRSERRSAAAQMRDAASSSPPYGGRVPLPPQHALVPSRRISLPALPPPPLMPAAPVGGGNGSGGCGYYGIETPLASPASAVSSAASEPAPSASALPPTPVDADHGRPWLGLSLPPLLGPCEPAAHHHHHQQQHQQQQLLQQRPYLPTAPNSPVGSADSLPPPPCPATRENSGSKIPISSLLC